DIGCLEIQGASLLIKFPDFYNSEIFREADKEEDITFNTL
ncbi:hypothetical protein EC2719100_5350, partial [Escherichia coli 2719100]